MGLRHKKSRLEQATDMVEGYVDTVRPHVQAALETAVDSTRDFVQETAIPAFNELADAKVAELGGEQPKKKSKLKRVLLLGLVAGGAAFVAKRLQGGGGSDNWQSSYVPNPAPTPAASAAAQPSVEDTGGASPDEALSDEAEAPHEVTTPDEPADVVEIDPEGGANK